VLGIQGPAAGGVDAGDHLVVAVIDDAVVAPVRAAAGLGFEAGPVFDGKPPLVAPAIGMERLDHIHGRSVELCDISQALAQRGVTKTAGCLRDRA